MAASVAVGTLLLLAVAWYDAVVAFGFLIFGVVFSEPALPDLVFAVVILAAALTGGGRLTLRRAPPLVVYLLGAFLVLNMLAAAWAPSLGTPVFFVAITTYLMAFGLWVSAYVDSSDRARRVAGWLTIGATITAGLSLAALFLAFPGSNVLTFALRHPCEGPLRRPECVRGVHVDPARVGALRARGAEAPPLASTLALPDRDDSRGRQSSSRSLVPPG